MTGARAPLAPETTTSHSMGSSSACKRLAETFCRAETTSGAWARVITCGTPLLYTPFASVYFGMTPTWNGTPWADR